MVQRPSLSKPLVTVTVPCYNHEKFVEQAIMSIVNQTYGYENIELIVIDDASQDNTANIVRDLSNKYNFLFFENPANLGVVKSMNRMITLAKGEYVSGCASDDFWHPHKLEEQVSLMESRGSEYAVCHTCASIINETGKFLFFQNRGVKFKDIIIPKILIDNGIVAPSVLVRRSIYDAVGKHDEKMPFEDREMWIRIASHSYKFAFIDKPLVYRRHHVGNLGRDVVQNYETYKMIFNKYQNEFIANDLVKEYHFIMFKRAAKFNHQLAIKHLRLCKQLIIKRLPYKSIIQLLIPYFILRSSLSVKLKKWIKTW